MLSTRREALVVTLNQFIFLHTFTLFLNNHMRASSEQSMNKSALKILKEHGYPTARSLPAAAVD